MNKKICFLLIFVLMISALAIANCSKEEEDREFSKIPDPAQLEEMEMLALMPENTQFLVKFAGIKTLYKQFAVSERSILGFSLKEKDIEQMVTKLGFNPLNPNNVMAAGFNPGKPFCLAFTNIKVNSADKQKTNFDVLSLLPVSDGSKALATIRTSLAKNKIDFEEEKKNGVSFIKWKNPEANACLTVKRQYLYLSINLQTDSQSFLESVLKSESSLTTTKAFRDVSVETDFSQELVFYLNISNLVEANLNEIKQAAEKQSPKAMDTTEIFESIKEYSSGTVAADLDNPNFTVKTIVAIAPDSEIKKVWNIGQINREKVLSINEPAALLVSFGANLLQYYKMITEMMPSEKSDSIKTRLDSFSEMSGIDVEKELINNLGGSINLAFYDGASITMLNYNSLFTASVKDEEVMKKLIDKAIMLLPPEKQAMISRQKIGEKNTYVLNAGLVQMYAGVDDHKFLLATGKPMFEKALSDRKDTGFAVNLNDEQLKNSLFSDQNIFYLNLDEVVKIVNNFAMFLIKPAGGEQKFKDKLNAAGKFEYLLSSSKIDEDTITSHFTVKTRFSQPFFIEIANMIDELELHEKSSNEP